MATSDRDLPLRDIALPAYGPTVVSAVGTGAVTPMLAFAAHDLGASTSLAALIVGLGLFAELFFAIPAGALIARLGERRALIIAAFVDAGVSFVALVSPSLPILMVGVFALGFTNAAFLIARQGYLSQVVPLRMRARALSTLGGVNRIGLFMGPFIAAPVVHTFGARAAFGVAVFAGLASALIVIFARDITSEHDAAQRLAPRQGSWQVIRAHSRIYRTIGVGVLMIGVARASRVAIFPLWAAQEGLPPSTTAIVFGIAGGVEMLIFYPAGSIMDAFGRVYVAVPCVALIGLGIGLLPLTHSALALLGVLLIAAIGNGLGSGIIMTLGADLAPLNARAQFLGGWRFASVLGGSIAPLAIGGLTAVASLATAAFTCAGLCAFGALWLARWVPAYDPRRTAVSDKQPGRTTH